MRLFLFATLVALAGSQAVAADRPRPSVEDLVKGLTPGEATRSYGLSKGVTVEGGTTQPAKAAVDLEVNFEFNSATLTTDAALTLDNLGRALKTPDLAGFRFLVAGHTDGVGGDAFNLALSERRAAAVKDYLAARHGIAANRLDAVGHGKRRLLDPSRPDAAVNRRVQVTNLGG